MAWIPVGAWIAAVMIALVILGFCVYEISWKTRRLRFNLTRLQDVAVLGADLQARLSAVRERAVAGGKR